MISTLKYSVTGEFKLTGTIASGRTEFKWQCKELRSSRENKNSINTTSLQDLLLYM
jgi:hypothetical protein